MTRRLAAAALAVLTLTGCALGARPTMTDERLVDDSAIDAVLDRLDTADASAFTAVYSLTPTTAGSATTQATVTASPGSSLIAFTTDGVVTVEYVTEQGEQRTCTAGQAECAAGLDETRISNLPGVTSSFWGPSAAQKLRTDAGRNVADATPSTTTIAGHAAACAAVPVGTTSVLSVEYCALDAGPLGAYRGADVAIELVSYTPGG